MFIGKHRVPANSYVGANNRSAGVNAKKSGRGIISC